MAEKAPENTIPTTNSDITIVGIGASAGGLRALEALLRSIPAATGLAYVVIVHLDAKRKSLLPELLQRATKLPVTTAGDGDLVEGDRIYVLPPGMDATITDGVLRLIAREQRLTPGLAIDFFFKSLALDRGRRAVAIVLSGTGTDGTLGVRAIKAEGGLVMVQDESAAYDGMPTSAVSTGLVDYVLPPRDMPATLLRYLARSGNMTSVTDSSLLGRSEPRLRKILSILRNRTGHDFSQYKPSTIRRRIDRRMSVLQLDVLDRYIELLQTTESEADTLFRELLISVTSFFRDPAAFESLAEKHLLAELSAKAPDKEIRVWVPACSSGEEAYSIAILLHEVVAKLPHHLHIQVFGTDIDERSIETARAGRYPANIRADLTADRLQRYFDLEEDGSYRICKTIREMLVFAPQSLIKDPPFSKLDLISCRNVLIYFSAKLQKQVLSLFHYSLLPEGLLLLGTSESIGPATERFRVADKKWKIFRRQPVANTSDLILDLPPRSVWSFDPESPDMTKSKHDALDPTQLIRAVLRQSDTPPCVVVDSSMDVVFVYGSTGRFLEPAEGIPSNNLSDMARPGLETALATCVQKAFRTRRAARQRGVVISSNGDEITLDLDVRPIVDMEPLAELAVVYFLQPATAPHGVEGEDGAHGDEDLTVDPVDKLQRRLIRTREDLRATIEEAETSNEELKSTNEELQSTNEELQSTNEELETSKEELQSLNEESVTVNAELQSRLDELSRSNDDLKNLLVSTGIATIFLDIDLCVRRFTPSASALIPLTESDQGRPLRHFSSNLLDVDIDALAKDMLDDLVVREREVETDDGRHYLLKVRPYKTLNNAIDGVVVTFEDRTEIKRAQQELQRRVDETTTKLDETSRNLAQARESQGKS